LRNSESLREGGFGIGFLSPRFQIGTLLLAAGCLASLSDEQGVDRSTLDEAEIVKLEKDS
jgi:hypothetical protein